MDNDVLDVYIVLLKALESGPFKNIAKQLRDQLENQVNDTRVDFLGNKHKRDLNGYIARLPNGKYINKLLANVSKSILKTHNIPNSYTQNNINMFHRVRNRMLHGTTPLSKTIPIEFYKRYELCTRSMGHLAEVYCVCFDQTGQFIITGSDDHLIKIWCAHTYRLLRTLRGHTGKLCDISVNYENRLLASAGTDKIIRIWDLKSTKLLECFATHKAVITSVKFAPYLGADPYRYLISTSNDGSIIFWRYHKENFGFQLVTRIFERNIARGRITCSSFSTGGMFLACGASDNCIHVYGFFPYGQNPVRLMEIKDAHKDSVDSLQFCNHGYRFVSGSKDGTATIWSHKNGLFIPLKLDVHTQSECHSVMIGKSKKQKPLVILFVQWSRDDRFVITSLNDASIKVWESRTGKLVHVLRGHSEEVFHIESHPHDPRVFVSASHDGTFCIWDITTGKAIKKVFNYLDPSRPQGAPPEFTPKIFDIKFSPDGTTLATTDSQGYLTIYRIGTWTHSKIPDQMFLSTDYAHIIHDVQHFVMDEPTHMPPYMLPMPYLVDMNGVVYPDNLQPLVTDYQGGQRSVVPEMTAQQRATIENVIKNHYEQEWAEYNTNKQQAVYPACNYDSDETIVDSDATEIDDSYTRSNCQQSTSSRSLRSRHLYYARSRAQFSQYNNDPGSSNANDTGSAARPKRRPSARQEHNVQALARRSPRTKRPRRSLYRDE